MQLLDITLPTVAENLALDEALLEAAENSALPVEYLRFWQPQNTAVIVGRSSQLNEEVHINECQRTGIPILRRTSGGAAIVTGQGCLMYAVVLHYEIRPQLKAVDVAHDFVLGTNLRGLSAIVAGAARRGTSDLAIRNRKFSGNSLRCKRRAMLYHGTLLYDFDLSQIARCLKMPPRQPEYRLDRSHETFVINAPASPEQLKQALIGAWDAVPGTQEPFWHAVRELMRSRYSQHDWNYQR